MHLRESNSIYCQFLVSKHKSVRSVMCETIQRGQPGESVSEIKVRKFQQARSCRKRNGGISSCSQCCGSLVGQAWFLVSTPYPPIYSIFLGPRQWGRLGYQYHQNSSSGLFIELTELSTKSSLFPFYCYYSLKCSLICIFIYVISSMELSKAFLQLYL